jgi:hypothetical protein
VEEDKLRESAGKRTKLAGRGAILAGRGFFLKKVIKKSHLNRESAHNFESDTHKKEI